MKKYIVIAVLLLLTSCSGKAETEALTEATSETTEAVTTAEETSATAETTLETTENEEHRARTDEEIYEDIKSSYIQVEKNVFLSQELKWSDNLANSDMKSSDSQAYSKWFTDLLPEECDEIKEAFSSAYFYADIIECGSYPFNTTPLKGSIDETTPMLAVFDESHKAIGYYFETGVKYDSFIDELSTVYTDEALEKMLGLKPVFYNYNNELFFEDFTGGSDLSLVRNDLELVSKTDTEYVISCTNYYNKDWRNTLEYDEAKLDEYIKRSFEYKFVKTDEGWKSADIFWIPSCAFVSDEELSAELNAE